MAPSLRIGVVAPGTRIEPELAARLNAAGRLADMALGIRCLITDDPAEAERDATELDRLNRERRDLICGQACIRQILSLLPERRPLTQMKLVRRYPGAFLFKEISHRRAKAGVDDMVGRPGRHRLVAARQLVPALRPGLDPGKPQPDRGVDRLIVAKLEVQERLVDQRPPVAAIERIRPDEVERAGYRPPPGKGQHQQNPVCHPLAQQGEGLPREVGCAPFEPI